jgi:hypothetical protein
MTAIMEASISSSLRRVFGYKGVITKSTSVYAKIIVFSVGGYRTPAVQLWRNFTTFFSIGFLYLDTFLRKAGVRRATMMTLTRN